jgi:acyl carrier protein
MQIENRVRALLAHHLEIEDPATIPSDAPLFRGGLGLDSMTAVELLEELEREFHVRIEDDAFDVFDSLESLVRYLTQTGRA